MDEPTAPLTPPARRVPSWLVVGFLISAALGLRLFVVARTDVAARDSVGFIRYAHGLETEPLLKVLREGHQAPGYPVLVLLASWPVRAWRGDAGCDTMVLSCQIATALMATLSIIPTFLLGREIGGRKIGWIAAGIVLCLPTWLRITSDGLSEGTYLFWLATALWLGVRGLRRPGVGMFAACGLASGMAYLTRPEGSGGRVAFGFVLLGRQLFAAARQPWRRVIPQALGLASAWGFCIGPLRRHHRRVYRTRTRCAESSANRSTIRMGCYRNMGTPATDSCWPLGSTNPARSIRGWCGPSRRWRWRRPGPSTSSASASSPSVWQSFRGGPGPVRPWRALVAIVALHALILCRMASLSGYLSERHTLLFVLVGSLPAAAGLLWIAQLLRRVPVRIPDGRACRGRLARGLAGPGETAALQPGRAQGRRTVARQERRRGRRHPRPVQLGRVLRRANGCLHPGRAAGPALRHHRNQRQPAFAAAAHGQRESKDRPRPASLPLARNADARKGPGRRLCGAGESLPDPSTTSPQPEYRVGIKAASPTASVRSTAPGG